MLLTITSSSPPADDLGYLLHKNPANVRTVDLAFGRAHVFWPESTPERASVSLLVEVDPVGLVRRGEGDRRVRAGGGRNNQPFVAASLLSVAIAPAVGTAMAGSSDDRPDRVDASLASSRLTAGGRRAGATSWSATPLRTPRLPGRGRARSRSIRPVPEWGDSPLLSSVERSAPTIRGQPISSRTCTSCFRSSTMTSTTGSPGTRSRSCSGAGRGLARRSPGRELITRRYLRYRRPAHPRGAHPVARGRQTDPDR